MVKLKNLFRLKDGLGPCLEDANISQHLPLHGGFSVKYAIYIVELEAIKASAGRGVLLSRRHNIAEATPPVKKKKEEQEADHSNPL
jgi:hypothetical protein